MLIIANGAFKSGSTWQRDIVKNFYDFEQIPKKYQDKKRNSFINLSKLNEFIKSPLIKENNYIAKAHIYHKKQINSLIDKPNLKILMIKRDVKDSIVSHYHHFKSQRRISISFKLYYWVIGRFKALQIIKYNKNWDVNAENVFYSSYEKLKMDFESEVIKFASFLGKDISINDAKMIKEETDLKKMKKKSNRQWFFRKGETGDYVNYFNDKMINDLTKMSNKTNVIDKISYFLIFEIRIYLKRM